MTPDKAKAAAAKVRFHLERRISSILNFPASEMPHLSIGDMTNLLYLLVGDSTSDLGNFQSSFLAMISVISREEVWAQPAEPEEVDEDKPAEKVVIQ